METHGENPKQFVAAIIPARYDSVRLPGKMLLEIAGKPLVLHTRERAAAATTVQRVIVATDDQRIFDAVTSTGGEAVMTRTDHRSGSDRVAEAAEMLPEGSIVVNLQGDEPLISPGTIDAVVEALLHDKEASMATAYEPITSKHGELLNPNVVKVVVGDGGYALYFSRSPMPFPREVSLKYGGDPGRAIDEEPEILSIFKKHTGIYAYRREYLLRFASLPPTELETTEMLEQIRALEDGAKIRVVKAAGASIGVDTPADLDAVRLAIEFPGITIRRGTDDDLAAAADVYLRSVRGSYVDLLPQDFLEGLTAEQRQKQMSARRSQYADTYAFLTAEDHEKGILGFVDYAGVQEDNFGCDARIFSFYVVPEVQRRGLGGLLFRNCLRRLRSECYGSVCLDTFEINPYRRFYERQGGRIAAASDHEVNGETFPTVIYAWDDLSKV